jgi:hypothetical protein
MTLILRNNSPHEQLELLWPGYHEEARGEGIAYYARFKCASNIVDSVKPKPGDPCPQYTDAYAQYINVSYLTPDVCVIDVTYSTVTLTMTVDRAVGEVESDNDFIDATEVTTEGEEYWKPHSIWVSRKWVSRWDADEQIYYQSLVGHTNSGLVYILDEFNNASKYYSPYTLLNLGTRARRVTKNKYIREVYFEHKPDYWDTTKYTPYDFSHALSHTS